MSFLTFLGYFLLSMVIYNCIGLGVIYLYQALLKKKLENAVKNGEIKVVDLDALKKDNDTWH